MTDKQTINDYNREELIDILKYLYVQGSESVSLSSQIQSAENSYRQSRTAEALKDKRSKRSKIAKRLAVVVGLFFMFIDIYPTTDFFVSIGVRFEVFVFSWVVSWGLFNLVLWFFGFSDLKESEKITLNQQINDEIKQQGDINRLKQAQRELNSDSLFSYYISLIPQNFANLTDFSGMLVLLHDFRATNFQEAANLWRTEQHQQAVSQQQKKMAQQLQQSNAQIAQLRDQAQRLQRGQAATQDAAARANAQTAKVNEKLGNMERYGVRATIRR
ncbi:hypothetical protein [Streptococcus loxodontisalivarius]|uniref:Outer membrane murein-binding lipoprotein Lpp n=1 Tax=Streptococcus loxodontisalivarius TaxID=1349415 RepID=A0ABS2PUG1_9STRE|nr:hypothetical protein [Streptococcus loxodontisalivarius]MBM7643689.1 outer membrane murein-binding lipoprotein Lpp [Streptococcus loxodontisalivarius]